LAAYQQKTGGRLKREIISKGVLGIWLFEQNKKPQDIEVKF
jgi:hypothetical protein